MNDKTASQLACEYKSSLQQNNLPGDRTLVPNYYLYNDRIVFVPRMESKFRKHEIKEASLSNLTKKKFTGKISHAQKSRIRKILTAWFSSLRNGYYFQDENGIMRKRSPVFITLTLPSIQRHSDEQIKRELLNHFIIQLRRATSVVHYFWRAESQKNGNIHFHLLIDAFVPYSLLLHMWNTIVNKLGYLDKFQEVHGHNSPNSVDIKKPKNEAEIVEYVIKYAAKDEENRLITGRIWGMSDSLRLLKVYSSHMSHSLEAKLLKAVEAQQIEVYSQDFFTVLIFKKEFRATKLYADLINDSSDYYRSLFNYLYLDEFRKEPWENADIERPEDFLQSKIDFKFE